MEIKAAKRLLDAVEAARLVQQFTAGINFEQFSKNKLIRSAVERQFEIIGEALGRAADENAALTGKISDLPKIVGLRNRLIHGYDSVDDEIVWDIIQNKVPALVKDLEEELKTSGYETGR